MFKSFRQSLKAHLPIYLAAGLMIGAPDSARCQPGIHQDPQRRLVTLSDGQGRLVLRLNYDGRCVLDQVIVRGRDVVGDSGVSTGIRMDGQWFTSRKIATPDVVVAGDTLKVAGITFGPGAEVHETWQFTVQPDSIVWRITRNYSTNAMVEDAAFPEWDFKDLATWTAGLLDNGGVIWSKYLDQTNATYGAHFGTVTFWNSQANDALRIIPGLPDNVSGAGRFSHQSSGGMSFNYVASRAELRPKYEMRRFLPNRQDLWAPFRVEPSRVTAQFTLKALDYAAAYDRGKFCGLDGSLVRDLLNTVPRYGVIDRRLTGGNGWRTGWICLHEPFFAEMGLAVDQDDYISNFTECLDFERDHAIGDDGRVKGRWRYTVSNVSDASCFYEPGCGCLLDSQPDFVINVAEQFNLTGDRKWLLGQKSSCEKALDYLMHREVDHSGLVAMVNDSTKQKKSSDWIDVIWASYENAFVNAALYEALELWARDENSLGDTARASAYRNFASRLKTSFNRPIDDGGFWDPANQWYVYWRDKDGSIHGDNLVEPVNFAAIAYGLCDDPARKKAILDRMEREMQKERLFSWPLCFYPFQPDEGAKLNFPFPRYENGDIFLSWNELGVRAYAGYKPAIALKYIRNILARYARDGLSYQHYQRKTSRGAGADILAGNCMAVVALYRDIYGLQPQPNRLYLEPHLTPGLNGTKLRYELRGTTYWIHLSTDGCAISAGACTVGDSTPFAVNATDHGLEYFPGRNPDWAMAVSTPDGQPVTIQIESWPDRGARTAESARPKRNKPDALEASRDWTETSPAATGRTQYVVKQLQPGTVYELKINGQACQSLTANPNGQISFTCTHHAPATQRFQLNPRSETRVGRSN